MSRSLELVPLWKIGDPAPEKWLIFIRSLGLQFSKIGETLSYEVPGLNNNRPLTLHKINFKTGFCEFRGEFVSYILQIEFLGMNELFGYVFDCDWNQVVIGSAIPT